MISETEPIKFLQNSFKLVKFVLFIVGIRGTVSLYKFKNDIQELLSYFFHCRSPALPFRYVT